MIDLIRAGRFEIPVLYEDNHLLVVVKPANLPVQADTTAMSQPYLIDYTLYFNSASIAEAQ